jgi:ABC-type uncharacterized transport system permease subunit
MAPTAPLYTPSIRRKSDPTIEYNLYRSAVGLIIPLIANTFIAAIIPVPMIAISEIIIFLLRLN